MTCCGCTFLVIASLAMACSIGALWLPFLVVIPDNNSNNNNDGTTVSSSALAPLISSHARKAAATSSSSKVRSMKEQQLSGLPDNSAQCPFFNGPCWVGSHPLSTDDVAILQTDDVVALAGCSALGTPEDPGHSRFWACVAAALSGATLLIAIGHASKGNNFGHNAAMIKFGAAGVAGMHVGASIAAIAQEGPIAKCVQNAIVDLVDFIPGSYTIIMLSLLMTICASGLQFLNAIGMLLSWCVSCCGAPAGRDYMLVIVNAQTTYEQPLYPGQMGTLPPLPPPQQSYDPYGRQVTVQYAAPGYPVGY